MIHIRALLSDIFAPVDGPALRTPSGVELAVYDTSVNRAMKVSAVYSAVKLISEGVARLALQYQRYNAAKQCYVANTDSALYSVLRLAPGRHITAFDFWCNAIQQVLLNGNAYMLPTKERGDITALTLLSPGACTYNYAERIYEVSDIINNIYRTVNPADIVHLRNLCIDGTGIGISTVQYAAQALGIIRLSDQNTATTLSNGGRMRGLLSGSGGVNTFAAATTNQLDSVSATIEDDIRAGRTVIPVPEDMKFQPISLSPADAKVLESKQFTIRDVARFFRVHPALLYEESNNTYKSAEVPNVMFLTQTLAPLLVKIEQELALKLIPAALRGSHRIRFDREELYTTDLLTEADYFGKMLQTGVYTVNELRGKKGLQPIKGGDTPLVSANLKTTDEIQNQAKPRDNE